MANGTTYQLIQQLQPDNAESKQELLNHTASRLRLLATRMLNKFPSERDRQQSDDLCQDAALQLYEDLDKIEIESAQHFLRLAATKMRRVLVDTHRRYCGKDGQRQRMPGIVGREQTPIDEVSDTTPDPSANAELYELMQFVDELPDQQRTVIDLLFMHGFTHQEAADSLGVAVKTIQRTWRRARITLQERLDADFETDWG